MQLTDAIKTLFSKIKETADEDCVNAGTEAASCLEAFHNMSVSGDTIVTDITEDSFSLAHEKDNTSLIQYDVPFYKFKKRLQKAVLKRHSDLDCNIKVRQDEVQVECRASTSANWFGTLTPPQQLRGGYRNNFEFVSNDPAIIAAAQELVTVENKEGE